jgi:hypothetical protein
LANFLQYSPAADPEVLTASLTQLAFLAVRLSTYLALRLPAEITLPHKDYPLPTIFAPASSYLYRDVPFPGSTPTQSSTNSPVASRTLDQRPLPRPRTLFTNRPLPKLVKEDPAAFSIFVEGVTLLAWDIAWLCKSQGMGGLNSWTDICAVGRNLWQLLLAEHRPGATARATPVNRDSAGSGSTANETSAARSGSTPILFGQFSHGAAHSFFGSSEGMELLRSWRLQSPARAMDKIKSHLLAEMQGAEWEMLQADEDMPPEEEPVIVRGRRWSSNRKADSKAGKSGWTRVRPRNEDQGNSISNSNASNQA